MFSLPYGLGVQTYYKNKPLLIFNIHLDDLSQEKREDQITDLLLSTKSAEKMIIGGDLNEPYRKSQPTGIYQLLQRAKLQIHNTQPTYYFENPMICIDNILSRGICGQQSSSAKVINNCGTDEVQQFKTYGSDHLAVVLQTTR
jgi:endonuclease/exonuclease/phosphatase family metal-dependent hydrolase